MILQTDRIFVENVGVLLSKIDGLKTAFRSVKKKQTMGVDAVSSF